MSEDKICHAQVLHGRINCTPIMNAENVPMVPLDYCKRLVEEAYIEGYVERGMAESDRDGNLGRRIILRAVKPTQS